MSTVELARLVNGKRIGKGRYIAKCPAHPDKHPSLSIAEGKRGVLVYCQSAHCTTKEICDAVGVRVTDLFYDSRKYELTPEMRARIRDEKRLNQLEVLVTFSLGWHRVVYPEKNPLWDALERKCKREIQEIQDRLYPERRAARLKKEKLDRFTAKYGWDRLWHEFLKSEKGNQIAQQYGR